MKWMPDWSGSTPKAPVWSCKLRRRHEVIQLSLPWARTSGDRVLHFDLNGFCKVIKPKISFEIKTHLGGVIYLNIILKLGWKRSYRLLYVLATYKSKCPKGNWRSRGRACFAKNYWSASGCSCVDCDSHVSMDLAIRPIVVSSFPFWLIPNRSMSWISL